MKRKYLIGIIAILAISIAFVLYSRAQDRVGAVVVGGSTNDQISPTVYVPKNEAPSNTYTPATSTPIFPTYQTNVWTPGNYEKGKLATSTFIVQTGYYSKIAMYLAMSATSTSPVLRWKVDYSPDGNYWYQEDAISTTTAMSIMPGSLASGNIVTHNSTTTIMNSWAPETGTSATTTKVIVLPLVPSKFIRVSFWSGLSPNDSSIFLNVNFVGGN